MRSVRTLSTQYGMIKSFKIIYWLIPQQRILGSLQKFMKYLRQKCNKDICEKSSEKKNKGKNKIRPLMRLVHMFRSPTSLLEVALHMVLIFLVVIRHGQSQDSQDLWERNWSCSHRYADLPTWEPVASLQTDAIGWLRGSWSIMGQIDDQRPNVLCHGMQMK